MNKAVQGKITERSTTDASADGVHIHASMTMITKQNPRLADRQPKIAHICTTFNHRAGGHNRLFRRLSALADNGYRIVLIVGRDYEPSPDWELNNMEVYRIESLVKYINPIKDLRALGSLKRLISKIRPGAVHTHLAKAGILGRWAAFFCHTPLILHTVHGPTFPDTLPPHKRIPYLIAEWITGRITDYFVFVGEELRGDFIKRGVCQLRDSVVIRTGRPDAEIVAFQSKGAEALTPLRQSFLKNGDGVLIANVGRVVPSKQQDHAIRVLYSLRKKGIDAHLALIGQGLLIEEQPYMAGLIIMVERLGLSKHVTFAGHREDALDIMAASDAILHTSRYEGLPNIIVEGGLAARPVVTYAVSGAHEIIDNGKTGFVVPQGDMDRATEILFFLAKNPQVSRRVGIRARAAVSAEYRESVMVEKKLAFYRNVFKSQSIR